MEINEIYTMIHMVKSCHLVAILSESVIYEEEGYKAIPIKEAKETMHASLVYAKGMYQRNAVKEFFKRMQIGKFWISEKQYIKGKNSLLIRGSTGFSVS